MLTVWYMVHSNPEPKNEVLLYEGLAIEVFIKLHNWVARVVRVAE